MIGRPKEDAVADLETNKRTVVEYYELAFNEHKPEEAVERYVGSEYIQHNPQAPDGPEAFIAFVNAFPEISVDIRRVIAEGGGSVTDVDDDVDDRTVEAAHELAHRRIPLEVQPPHHATFGNGLDRLLEVAGNP